MIELQSIDGLNCPVLICDICGERIEDAGKGAAIFDNFAPTGSRVKVLMVHKGNIDGRTCHQDADALIATDKGRAGWQELKRHFVDLLANVGFSVDAAQAYEEARRGQTE